MTLKQTPLPVAGIQHRNNLVPLTEQEIRFEIDMCIGCDRCMRACPLPLSSQMNIAELNLATVSHEVAPHIARFTQECVMCSSCVPVCPVNNHRDLLMFSLKQRLGVPWDGNVDLSRILGYLPEGWSLPQLLSRLRKQPMFTDEHLVPEHYLKHLLASSRLRALAPGATVIREGTYGREIYFILDGRFLISSPGPNSQSVPIAILSLGECMGEREMLTGQQHTANIQAQTRALALEVPEQVMQRMMEIIPSVRSYFESLNNGRSIESILKRMALFRGVTEPDLQWIARKIMIKIYERDQLLFSMKGESKPEREVLHIILEGFVKVTRAILHGADARKESERIIAYRQNGDYFVGGLDMLGDGKAVIATAINRVRVAEIGQQDFLAILSRYPELQQRFIQHFQEYQELVVQASDKSKEFLPSGESGILSEAETRVGLRALVGGGVVEGTEVLVIDLDKCVHCDKCEDACERRHGHSRMNRKGMVVGNISIATACRHCQDPVCMLCSRAGIARMPSGEVYITDSCIGCGICAERCPYDNISIITLTEEQESRSVWERFTHFFTKGIGKEYGGQAHPLASSNGSSLPASDTYDAGSEVRKKLAIKCDLCAGYNNQACVQACPTGAAFRVHPVQFFGTREETLYPRAQ